MHFKRVLDYSFLNAKIRAHKSDIFPLSFIDKLLAASSLSEIARQLAGTQYSTVASLLQEPVIDPIRVEEALRSDFNSFILKLIQYIPKRPRPFLEHFLRKDFYQHLKHTVRQIDAQHPIPPTAPILLLAEPEDQETLHDLMDIHSLQDLPKRISNEELRSRVEAGLEEYLKEKNTLPIEVAIDGLFFEKLWKLFQKLPKKDQKSVIEILGCQIDLTNLLILFRARRLNLEKEQIQRFLIPQNVFLGSALNTLIETQSIDFMWEVVKKTRYSDISVQVRESFESLGSIYEFERYIDQYLIHQAFRIFRTEPFHIGVFLAFLILKEQESRNLRAVIIGKIDNLSPERIKGVLTIF